MLVKKIILLLLLFSSTIGLSQEIDLTPLSKISVLTCGPGEELYSSFGHSAFRVQDTSMGIDVVYNYGVFDDTSKNFYLKFIRGQMDYRLARQYHKRFLRQYEYENRWVKEQELNLTLKEKNDLFHFLEKNNLPENRVYKYDFFFDNCSTKIWDVSKKALSGTLIFNDNYLENQFTFRELIHQNLKTNSWSAFGIDLALGSIIDREATPKEHIFLPLYMMQQLNYAKLDTRNVASKEIYLFKDTPRGSGTNLFFSPLFWAIIVLILVVLITYMDHKKKKRSRWLDFSLFLLTGIAGLLLFFLWFLTDHSQTVSNFNILWVFPLNLIVAFILVKRKVRLKWIQKYIWVLLGLIVITVLIWVFKIQVFSPLNIFILLALTIRYLFLQQYFKPEISKS